MCIRDRESTTEGNLEDEDLPGGFFNQWIYDIFSNLDWNKDCLLYTSDAADERSSVDLGGRRIIKKKNNS